MNAAASTGRSQRARDSTRRIVSGGSWWSGGRRSRCATVDAAPFTAPPAGAPPSRTGTASGGPARRLDMAALVSDRVEAHAVDHDEQRHSHEQAGDLVDRPVPPGADHVAPRD